MFSLTFLPQACYPSLVVEQDTPQGTVFLHTSHLSSQTVYQLVNKGVYSVKLDHPKAVQAIVQLVNQLAVQSDKLIPLLLNQAKKKSVKYETGVRIQPNEYLSVYDLKGNTLQNQVSQKDQNILSPILCKENW